MSELTNSPLTGDLAAQSATPQPPVAVADGRVARQQNSAAKEVILLVNRTAGARGGHGRAEGCAEAIADAGLRVHRVEQYEQTAELSAKLAADGALRAVVAVGGDGTVGLALNATPPGTPLAVVPAGTENLLAKYVKSTARPADLSRLLREGVTISLDAGSANGRLFALMISVGLDAEVVRRVHANRTGNITHLAYAEPIVRAMGWYSYPPIQASWLDSDGAEKQVTGRWLFGVNLPRYAQNVPIVPEADGADGLLDLCVFERGGTAAGLWYLWHVIRGLRAKLSSVTATKLKRFTISSVEEDVHYQLDGDPGGVLPVEVTVAPGRLTLLVTKSVARRLGFDC